MSTTISMPVSSCFWTRFSKFVPPPEANTATRVLTMYGDPFIVRHFTDQHRFLTDRMQMVKRLICILSVHYKNKTDAHIKDIVCFFGLYAAQVHQPVDDFRKLDVFCGHISAEFLRKRTWNVFDEAAACNMAHRLHIDLFHQALHLAYVYTRRFKKQLDPLVAVKRIRISIDIIVIRLPASKDIAVIVHYTIWL